ncbi:hypothetical protein PACTADRAFT_30986 [Pachysolen tannophilus NRRL Y-2460]|uniref:Uncharacterized protein n=1 Tax=Pachysolen tannophilus NRRL Y-2460 TaxID=669874 RepID=A0A1E4U0L9_PACTA|nr:hypothetical protein PACTADRAFT_30986 [Pachysolen tannophilus NRRL Y-2460]
MSTKMSTKMNTVHSVAESADQLEDGLEYDVSEGEVEGVEGVEGVEEGEIDDSKFETTETIQSGDGTDKKRKRKKNDKLALKKKIKTELEIDQKKKLSLEKPDIVVEYFASKIRQQQKDLSPLELGELYIDESFIKYSGNFQQLRNLDNLSKFIENKFQSFLPKIDNKKIIKKKTPKKQDKIATLLKKKQEQQENQRHFITILSMSAIRTCDVHRATKNLHSIKLIKKNKLKDDLETLSATSSRVLCATPSRMLKILDQASSTLLNEKI